MKSGFVHMAIELNIECPNEDCSGYFDLFKQQEFTEEGFLYDLLMPKNETWGCDDFQKQIEDAGLEIICPDCKTKIEVESVEW